MPEKPGEQPYVPAETSMPEMTAKALILGLVMAAVLGAANAYLGLKAGQTVSATFPAAVIAIAAFRLPFFRGSILEQNTMRIAAAVGEALVAGAIFTVPAFVIVEMNGERLWTSFRYWETSMMLLIGGVLGVLFIILLRRTLTVDSDLPFPESRACFEIVKAGQHGESGAKYIFGAMGLGMLIQIFKDSKGLAIFRESLETVVRLPQSLIHHFSSNRTPMGDVAHTGALRLSTPAISPALMGVGYIIGYEVAAINFTGGVLAWLVFIPLAVFLNPELPGRLMLSGASPEMSEVIFSIWYNQVRPIAVGAMIVGAMKTMWGLRGALGEAFQRALRKGSRVVSPSRLEQDLDPKIILIATAVLVVPMSLLYYYFSQSVTGAIVSAVVMLVMGFLLSAVGGWLVGLVGGSNQPVSGLTLSTLVIAALLMVAFGVTGLRGVGAVLGVAAVVACATSMAGDMIQDLKVGHLLGGTPRKMEITCLLSTIVVAFVLVAPIIILHEGNLKSGGIGIGDRLLPAPQAGLMAQLAKGIVGGEMPWGLIIFGMCFSGALILIKAPSPMLIAVGMYLPFETTFAIFTGGLIRLFVDRWVAGRKLAAGAKENVENTGTLIASGLIAGEALTGVLLAGLVLAFENFESITRLLFGVAEFDFVAGNGGAWMSLLMFGVIVFALVVIPLRRARAA
ncbi:oligopeptide transporter, OPT family [bacterium]|nr:oligopeptide transporter, OPT family [bacterium]